MVGKMGSKAGGETNYRVAVGDEESDRSEDFANRADAQAAFDKIVAGPAEVVGYIQIAQLLAPVGTDGEREILAEWEPAEGE